MSWREVGFTNCPHGQLVKWGLGGRLDYAHDKYSDIYYIDNCDMDNVPFDPTETLANDVPIYFVYIEFWISQQRGLRGFRAWPIDEMWLQFIPSYRSTNGMRMTMCP